MSESMLDLRTVRPPTSASGVTVAEAFAAAVERAVDQGRDDVLAMLLNGMAEITPAVARPSDSEIVGRPATDLSVADTQQEQPHDNRI